VLGSGLLAWPVSRLFGYDTKTFVPPVMFTNSGNMGLPLAVFAFGEMALPAAVMLFIVENTLHFTVGSRIMDKRAPLGMIFRLPMLIATIGGLVVSLVELRIPTVIATPIEMVGQVAIPLMLFSLGVRLISIDYSDWKVGLVAAVTTPVTGVVLALAYHAVLPVPDSQFALFILFGALPPAVLNFMVAEKYAQEPARVASIVMLGNLASIVTVPIVLAFVL
jgi:predicted permease